MFVQAFERGEAVDRDGSEVRRLLIPQGEPAPSTEFARVSHGDGEADVYGVPAPARDAARIFARWIESAYSNRGPIAGMGRFSTTPRGTSGGRCGRPPPGRDRAGSSLRLGGIVEGQPRGVAAGGRRRGQLLRVDPRPVEREHRHRDAAVGTICSSFASGPPISAIGPAAAHRSPTATAIASRVVEQPRRPLRVRAEPAPAATPGAASSE